MPRQHLGVSLQRFRSIIIIHVCPCFLSRRHLTAACVSLCQAAGAALWVSAVASSAHAVRAVLLAIATVTSRCGLRSSRDRTQAAVRVWLVSARRVTDVAPTIGKRRRSPLPIFETRPSRSFPPDEFCLGTSPSQAANCRPDLKVVGSGTLAASAVAVMTPTPGIVSSRWLAAFCRCRTSSCRSILRIASARCSSCDPNARSAERAIAGRVRSSGSRRA